MSFHALLSEGANRMRRLSIVLTLFAVLSGASVAQVAWGGDFWERCWLDWHRMNCWPEPFQHSDRELVRLPLITMTDNGWRLQNTLSDHFFTGEQQQLTQAGLLHVRWIVTQAPPHRRTVFVLRASTAEVTAARVESVQQAVSQLCAGALRPEVLLTDTAPVGGSGEYFDAVDRQLRQSIPAPRLPQAAPTTN